MPKFPLVFLSLITMAATLSGCGGAGAGAYGSEGSNVLDAAPAPAPIVVTPSASSSTASAQLQSNAPPAGQAPSPYAGVWAATYDGVDKGSCAPVTIDNAGSIAGACFSSIGNASSAIQGVVAADGNATVSYGAASATVRFSSTTSGSGPSSSPSGAGTISLTRVN